MPGVCDIWYSADPYYTPESPRFLIETGGRLSFETEGAGYVFPETEGKVAAGRYTLRQAARRIRQLAGKV